VLGVFVVDRDFFGQLVDRLSSLPTRRRPIGVGSPSTDDVAPFTLSFLHPNGDVSRLVGVRVDVLEPLRDLDLRLKLFAGRWRLSGLACVAVVLEPNLRRRVERVVGRRQKLADTVVMDEEVVDRFENCLGVVFAVAGECVLGFGDQVADDRLDRAVVAFDPVDETVGDASVDRPATVVLSSGWTLLALLGSYSFGSLSVVLELMDMNVKNRVGHPARRSVGHRRLGGVKVDRREVEVRRVVGLVQRRELRVGRDRLGRDVLGPESDDRHGLRPLGGRLHVDVLLDERVRERPRRMPRRRAGVVPDAADSLFVAPDDAISESVLRQARGRRLSHFLNQPVTNFCLLDGLLVPLQIREVLREIPRKLCWIVGGMGSPSIWAWATSESVHARRSSL